MSDLIYIELIAVLLTVLAACGVGYGVVTRKIMARKILDRREYLKARARAL